MFNEPEKKTSHLKAPNDPPLDSTRTVTRAALALGDVVNQRIAWWRLLQSALTVLSVLDVTIALDVILPRGSLLLTAERWVMAGVSCVGAYGVWRVRELMALDKYLRASLADSHAPPPPLLELFNWSPFFVLSLTVELLCWLAVVPMMVVPSLIESYYLMNILVFSRTYTFVSYFGATHFMSRASCRALANLSGIDIGWSFALRSTFQARPLRSLLVVTLLCMIPSTLLFMRVERVSLYTAIYFAIESVTAVGYGDVVPHTWQGKLITVLLGSFNICGLSYFLHMINVNAEPKGDVLRMHLFEKSFRLRLLRRYRAASVIVNFFRTYSESAGKRMRAFFCRWRWRKNLHSDVHELRSMNHRIALVDQELLARSLAVETGVMPIDDGLLSVSSRHSYGMGRHFLPPSIEMVSENENQSSSVRPSSLEEGSVSEGHHTPSVRRSLLRMNRRMEALEYTADRLLLILQKMASRKAGDDDAEAKNEEELTDMRAASSSSSTCSDSLDNSAERNDPLHDHHHTPRGGRSHMTRRHFHSFSDCFVMASRLMRLPMPALQHWAARHHFRLPPHHHRFSRSDAVFFLLKEAFPHLTEEHPQMRRIAQHVDAFEGMHGRSADALRRSLVQMSHFGRRVWAARNGLLQTSGDGVVSRSLLQLKRTPHPSWANSNYGDIPRAPSPRHVDADEPLPA
jgi:hypothetical protein